MRRFFLLLSLPFFLVASHSHAGWRDSLRSTQNFCLESIRNFAAKVQSTRLSGESSVLKQMEAHFGRTLSDIRAGRYTGYELYHQRKVLNSAEFIDQYLAAAPSRHLMEHLSGQGKRVPPWSPEGKLFSGTSESRSSTFLTTAQRKKITEELTDVDGYTYSAKTFTLPSHRSWERKIKLANTLFFHTEPMGSGTAIKVLVDFSQTNYEDGRSYTIRYPNSHDLLNYRGTTDYSAPAAKNGKTELRAKYQVFPDRAAAVRAILDHRQRLLKAMESLAVTDLKNYKEGTDSAHHLDRLEWAMREEMEKKFLTP